jgi:sacsin
MHKHQQELLSFIKTSFILKVMNTDFGTDFGQKVDLTASIRNILRNYPEGTAILKELVQNADDAGARTVSFCLDHRTHNASKLASKSLEQFQGPSLLIYNNAIFTETDFQSIQRIGDSLKKSEDSKAKIGRFGIGFNAVYHWTDLPSFVSNKYLVMLDPQAKYLPNVNPSNPGKIIDFVTNPDILNQFPDQFAPYFYNNNNFKKPFQGTLFRLPLRTNEQAVTSMLSKRALTVDNARALFEALQLEASAMLLFLKNIECIEIQEWREGAQAPIALFRCEIANPTTELRQKRNIISSHTVGGGSNPNNILYADYALSISCVNCNHPSNGAAVQYLETWEVCNQLGGQEASRIANNPDNALLRLIPWGGVAACIRSVVTSGASDGRELSGVRAGLAYCFLPLPVQTGLPVMCNGFFELSSNRRDVWQAGVDMTGNFIERWLSQELSNVSLFR